MKSQARGRRAPDNRRNKPPDAAPGTVSGKKVPDKKKFAAALLRWFSANKRDLPWRNEPDAYKIWVSEVMLQQTQVATVIPYYHRFLEQFPTVEKLAAAPQDRLMKAWEGLGYYARARNLQSAAQTVVTEYGGKLPVRREELLKLKGFGAYTSASVASFAFGEDCAAVDGNVIRVLSRLCTIEENVGEAKTKETLQQIADTLLPKGKSAAFNEAMMELGATVCTPRNPRCERCPVAAHCLALQSGTAEKFPVKNKRGALPHHFIAVGVVERNQKVLIALRPAEGLLGNLWEFPGGKIQDGETPEQCCEREIWEETGLRVRAAEKIATVYHTYTHFKITLTALRCVYVSGEATPKTSQAVRWIAPEEFSQYAFPKANKTVIDALLHPAPVRQISLF